MGGGGWGGVEGKALVLFPSEQISVSEHHTTEPEPDLCILPQPPPDTHACRTLTHVLMPKERVVVMAF